jgi:hypothetical protein
MRILRELRKEFSEPLISAEPRLKNTALTKWKSALFTLYARLLLQKFPKVTETNFGTAKVHKSPKTQTRVCALLYFLFFLKYLLSVEFFAFSDNQIFDRPKWYLICIFSQYLRDIWCKEGLHTLMICFTIKYLKNLKKK